MGFDVPPELLQADRRPESLGITGRAMSPAARAMTSPRNRSPTKKLPLTARNVLTARQRIETDPQILPGVRMTMGGLYCQAVEACISGNFGVPADADEPSPRVGLSDLGAVQEVGR